MWPMLIEFIFFRSAFFSHFPQQFSNFEFNPLLCNVHARPLILNRSLEKNIIGRDAMAAEQQIEREKEGRWGRQREGRERWGREIKFITSTTVQNAKCHSEYVSTNELWLEEFIRLLSNSFWLKQNEMWKENTNSSGQFAHLFDFYFSVHLIFRADGAVRVYVRV